MRDKDKLKLKVNKILADNLSDEELLLVSVRVVLSAEDKRNEELKQAGYKEAHLVIAQKQADEVYADQLKQLAVLCDLLGLPEDSIPVDPFSLSVARYYDTTGIITPKQITAITKFVKKAKSIQTK